MRKPSKIQTQDGSYLYRCSKCDRYLSSICFCQNKSNKYKDGVHTYCKECQQKIELDYRNSLRDEVSLNFKLKHCFCSAKSRAKKSKIDFNLTLDYIVHLYNVQNGLCAISGIPMTYQYGDDSADTRISIDKIDPNKGYVIGNVQLVCWAVNRMKWDMTLEQLTFFCRNVVEYQNSKRNK